MGSAELRERLSKPRRLALGAGIAGLAVTLGLAATRGGTATESYLLAFSFWVMMSLGCLAVILLQHVTGGRWGLALRRILEAGLRTLPLMALLIVPVLLSLDSLYPWADADVMAHDAVLQKKAAYLNETAFVIRTIVYFVSWCIMAHLLYRWSGIQDERSDAALEGRFAKLSAPGLVIFALTITFASFDWIMTLEPHWFSTIYGVYVASGGALAALALAVLVASRLTGTEPLSRIVKEDLSNDFGNLMLAFTMFWAYIAFSQFLIIWCGNLPEETPWYLARFKGGWQFVGIALIVVHFLVPFLCLLCRHVRRRPQQLAKVAGLILFMRFIDTLWLVSPAFSPEVFRLHVLDLVAFVGVGGVWIWVFLGGLAARALLPGQDSRVKRLLAEGDGRHG